MVLPRYRLTVLGETLLDEKRQDPNPHGCEVGAISLHETKSDRKTSVPSKSHFPDSVLTPKVKPFSPSGYISTPLAILAILAF